LHRGEEWKLGGGDFKERPAEKRSWPETPISKDMWKAECVYAEGSLCAQGRAKKFTFSRKNGQTRRSGRRIEADQNKIYI